MEQLLQRYIRGKVSEEERLKVVSWLDESPDNMREFLALRKLYDISLWHTDTEQKTLHKKFGNYIQSYSITLVKRCKDLLSHIGRIFPYKNVFLSVSLTQQLTNHEL